MQFQLYRFNGQRRCQDTSVKSGTLVFRYKYIPHEGVQSTALPHDMNDVSIDPVDVSIFLSSPGEVRQ